MRKLKSLKEEQEESEESKSEKEEDEQIEKEKMTFKELELISKMDSLKTINRQKLKHKTLMLKLQKLVIIYTYACIIYAIFFMGYVLSKSILHTFQEGFQEFDVFYTRAPCVASSFYIL